LIQVERVVEMNEKSGKYPTKNDQEQPASDIIQKGKGTGKKIRNFFHLDGVD
jgi:hypothetical protein